MRKSRHAKNKSEIAMFPDSNDDDEFNKPVYEFERIKGRITHHLCTPLIKEIDFVDYSSFAKMPGVWLASSMRAGTEIPGSIRLKGKKIYYDHKKHVVKNCLRQLSRRKFESLLGKCLYSMTKYGDILRITIPYKNQFLIALNTQPKILDADFDRIDKDYHNRVIQAMETLKDLCTKKLDMFEKKKISSTKILKDFFSDAPKYVPELQKALSETSFNKKMRYISLGATDGIPLARFVNTDEHLLLDEFDEFEYFIETAAGMQMRDRFSPFFGGVKFNLTVYEKIAVMTIPIAGTRLFALVTIDNKMVDDEVSEYVRKCDREFYFPRSMSQISSFIEKLDSDYFTIDL